MRIFAPIALTLFSQTAAACDMGGMGAGPHSGGGGLGAGALMAGVAALGWWLLTKAHKETDKALLWSGRALGWLLLAGGLAGFLCAGLMHAARAWKTGSSCSMHGSGSGPGALPPGHPPIEAPRQP